MYNTQEERIVCYNKIKTLYKKRCDFVHDSEDSKIDDKDVFILREYVRKSIIKYWKNSYNKTELIKRLQDKIKSLDYWEQLNSPLDMIRWTVSQIRAYLDEHKIKHGRLLIDCSESKLQGFRVKLKFSYKFQYLKPIFV